MSCAIVSKSELVDQGLVSLDNIDRTICSKIEYIEDGINDHSVITNTLIDNVCGFDSQLDVIDDLIETIQSKVDLVEVFDSQIDVIQDYVVSIDSSVSAIENRSVVVESLLCTMIDAIDAINSSKNNVSIDSQIDVIDDDVSLVNIAVCTIVSEIDILSSRIDAIKFSIVEIGDGVSIIDSLLNT